MNSIFKTHTGKVRQVNQDYGLVTQLDENTTLVIVADGMGGHKAGEVASKMATEFIEAIILEHWDQMSWPELLKYAVVQANEQIVAQGKREVELHGMGTTIEVGLLTNTQGILAHVGDSRVYLLRDSTLEQLTEDHSFVYALYKSGQIRFEEMHTHPQKNVIMRSVGTEDHLDVDLIEFSWDKDDRVLFCSDGLFKHVHHHLLEEYMKESDSISNISDRLINKALEMGGDDNITLILVENTFPQEGGEVS